MDGAISPTPSRTSAIPLARDGLQVRAGAFPLAALVLAFAALALRLHHIDHEPLWLDEGYTLLFSRLPLPRLFLVGGAHEHPPLYYLVVHFILGVHNSYLVPRYLSAVAGSASVYALYLLGARLYGRVAGLVAAALLVVAPFQVWYGQDGRGYEFAGLLVLMSYYLALKALEERRTSLWLLYVSATAAALYTEYTTILVLLPQVLFLTSARRTGGARSLVFAWAGTALVFAPWIGILASNVAGIAGDYWIPAPNPAGVSNTILEFLGLMTPCPGTPCTGHEVGVPFFAGHEEGVGVLAAVAALTLTVGAAAQRRTRVLIVALWLVLPFGLVLALALQRSFYLDRVFLDSTFAFYLLLGAGVAAVRRRLLFGVAAVVTVGVLAASIVSLGPIYAGGINPDWKSASRDFSVAYRPGQSVLFYPGVLRSVVSSYLPDGWHATYETTLWTRLYVDVPGWQKRYPQPLNPDRRERSRLETILRNVQIAQAARDHRQVWLITFDYPGVNDTRRWFSEQGFQPVISQTYAGGTRIELWDRTGPREFGYAIVPAAGFGVRWHRQGRAQVHGGVISVRGTTSLSRRFAVQPGGVYSISVDFRGTPPASKPLVSLQVYGATGDLIATFPRTQWYDWLVNGVWISQPFGFVAPPGSSVAVLRLQTAWGHSYWRRVGVYRER